MLPHLTETCIIFAARYAHGRNTGASLAVTSCILAQWDDLTQSTRRQLAHESSEAQFDLECWRKIAARFEADQITKPKS